VTGLATAVAGLCEWFEGLSAVDVHRNAGRECAQRGMHCCRGRGCKGNLTNLRRILHLSLAKGNPK
jgi:hypothetical protein